MRSAAIDASKIPLGAGRDLARYAVSSFELGEKLLGVTSASPPGLFESLANSFARIGAGGDVEHCGRYEAVRNPGRLVHAFVS